MRSSAIFSFAVTMLIGACLIVLFTSYGNTEVHPGINEMIVESFVSKNKDSKTKSSEFKYYSFSFDILKQCKGTAITKSGFFQPDDINWINRKLKDATGLESIIVDLATLKATIEEGATEKSVKEWISHGGYSADEPELPASLRHFYDPLAPVGLRFLVDITNAKLMGLLQLTLTNPEIDGVDWALGKEGDLSFGVQEHSYTWEKGKAWMKMALQEKNEVKRSEYMGKAWRSLGETLHMIADNGCPPHVRDDAHPSPLINYNVIFGNPDPYEEIIDIVRSKWPSDFIGYFKGAPDKKLAEKMKGMKKAREIAHALAVYTNANFVTGETISGTDQRGQVWRQITHPDYTYPSPVLQQMNYDENSGIYSTTLNEYPEPIKQCCDKTYWLGILPEICYSYVTFDCVESQAKVLLPNVVEAGKRVMELFIPKLKIDIQSAENSRVKGQVSHTKDAEYTSEIRYNGKALLTILDNNFRKKGEAEIQVANGQFESQGYDFENGDLITLRIDFGGIGVESAKFRCGGTPPEKPALDEKKYKYMDITVYGFGKWSNKIEWNDVTWGNSDFVSLDVDDLKIPLGPGWSYRGKAWSYDNVMIDAEITPEKVVRLHITTSGTPKNCWVDNWDVVIENLPLSDENLYQASAGKITSTGRVSHGGDFNSGRPGPGPFIKKATCERVFPDGQRIQIVSIDWDYYEGSDMFSLRSFVSVRIN